MLVTILLGVVTLVVLVGSFLGAKRWHWAHVLTLVALYFASVGYLLLMLQSVNYRWTNQKREQQALANLERQQAENDALIGGTDDRAVLSRLAGKETLIPDGATSIGGIRRLEHEVRLLNRDRGRVWRDGVLASDVDPQTGAVTIAFPVPQAEPAEDGFEEEDAPAEPGALGLQTDDVVYVFEQGPAAANNPDAGRKYLGEFRVSSVEGRQASLEPLDQLSLDPVAGERLLTSDGPWAVYASMPADDRRLFLGVEGNRMFPGLDEEELRALMPEASIDEYLRDGGEATDDDDEFRVEWLDADDMVVGAADDPGKRVRRRFRRQPRDYAFVLKDLAVEQAELIAEIQAAEADVAKLNEALAGAEKLKGFREDERQKLQDDLDLLVRDRETIEQYVATLQSQIAKADRLLEETLRSNAAIAERIARGSAPLRPVASGALDVDGL